MTATSSIPDRVSLDEIRSRLSMVELLQRDNVDLRRMGPNLVALCPFHSERSPSFTVFGASAFAGPTAGQNSSHAHCFGCGWHGDIFTYWMERTGSDFVAAKAALAEMAGLGSHPPSPGLRRDLPKKVAPMSQLSSTKKQKPTLSAMVKLGEERLAYLAELRGLSLAGVQAAANKRLIGFCMWPQFVGFGQPDATSRCFPSWVITDDSRNVAQFRRLDGGKYRLHDREIKAWTKGSPTWPIGAADIQQKVMKETKVRNILLVEGGPDLLAAYHFLLADWRLKNGRPLKVPEILPVAMLGASCAIADEALDLFEGKRVRIIIHNDEPKQQGVVDGEPFYRIPSFEAAARWTEQLCAAGAAVETFSLAGITRGQRSEDSGQPEPKEISDLNDLALCSPEVWQAPEIRAAFFDWDF
jgi:hypothetical protein